jgi:hypothetical protein
VQISTKKNSPFIIEEGPNPFTDFINIEFHFQKECIVNMTLSSIEGVQLEKCISNKKITNEKFTVDNLESLSSGIYLLNILIDDKPHIVKIVKK